MLSIFLKFKALSFELGVNILTLIVPEEVKLDLTNFNVKFPKKLLYTG
jgi:hypothetical protein